MKSPLRTLPLSPGFALASLLVAFGLTTSAFAQDPGDVSLDEQPEAAEPAAPEPAETTEEEASAPETEAETEAEADAELGERLEEARENRDTVAKNQEFGATNDVTYWHGFRSDNNYFGWDGSMAIDVGYADYRKSVATWGAEDFYDFRGYAEFGPVFEHRFGKERDYFLRGQAQLVAWIREEPNKYQINVFDVYAQVGKRDVVDLQVGRYNSWRVFQRGSGIDIFTLEDTGALCAQSFESQAFCANMYEVDYMWLRGTQGRGAVHFYPLKKLVKNSKWNNLGFEGLVEYGKELLSNSLGFRGAVIYDTQFVKLSGGGEVRNRKQAADIVDASGTVCEDCTKITQSGLGGGIQIRPPYVDAAINFADAHQVDLGANGAGGPQGVSDTTTIGGYLELHTGHLLDKAVDGKKPGVWADQSSENIRQLTGGAFLSRTERVVGNGDFQQHVQLLAYLKYNLGFNESFLKLVVSKANAIEDDNTSGDPTTPTFITREFDMLSARLRFGYAF